MRVQGVCRVPGDKSISHRALLAAALAGGTSRISGVLAAADVRSTARVLRQLGIRISPLGGDRSVTVRGARFRPPRATLHCGNSGTTARLLLGAIAGQPVRARFSGDASLRRRPMGRVIEPLAAMGATLTAAEGNTLPIAIRGGRLHSIDYASPIASAQVKSAILYAALAAGVSVRISEPVRSRDHTERLFLHLGLDVRESTGAISYQPSANPLRPFDLTVPGDTSSAAFLVGAAVLAERGELLIEGVGVNPTRTGFLTVLARMGALVDRFNLGEAGGEPVADLLARPARLHGTEVTPDEVPALIDEVPLLAALAARASGETVFRGVGELRVKESDRLELIAANLRGLGVAAEVSGDDLHVRGTERPLQGRVDTAGDHRLAMTFAVLGTIPGSDVRLSERRSVVISFPRFFQTLRAIGRAPRHRD